MPRRSPFRLALFLCALCALGLIAVQSFLAAEPQSPAKLITGKVVGVADGDTLTVLDDAKQQLKIRLEGIDAPEGGQAFGTQAKKALSEKVFGKEVRIEWKARDRYGRILGQVFVDGREISLEMVADGYAWHFKKYSSDEEFAAAEVEARKAKLGLWQDGRAVAPWDYRAASAVGATSFSARGPPRDATAADGAVFVTKTGEKYHRGSCRHLAKSKIPISLEEAKRRYSPCKTCMPLE